MTRKEQLEKKQAEAEEAAKKARKELAKIKRAETRKAAQEAREKEQAHALAFLAYCKATIIIGAIFATNMASICCSPKGTAFAKGTLPSRQ